MTPEDLLRVEPEVLAKLILHKRERISQSLPKIIESLGEEKHTAENLARKSRAEKEDLEPKVSNLYYERAKVVAELNDKFDTIKFENDEKDRFDEISEKLKSKQTSVENFNKILSEIVELCSKYGGKIEQLTSYKSSMKANDALSEIIDDFENAKNRWNENESNRRRLESKFTKLSTNLRDSSTSKDYWQDKLNSDFEDLLIDAKRVAEGGLSSRQLSRNNKGKNNSRRP
ncbi:MAG TPA: hypothetical protein D7I03_05850 [Candidatus Poseidoniales archaeon]|nr:MAG TPA: hypothetical protein D7I03_05850 [Candidatus Poseidoniales archaeon]HII50846.1 hypothetical protein [Candidatus Poseidoniaceae archaeon]